MNNLSFNNVNVSLQKISDFIETEIGGKLRSTGDLKQLLKQAF